MSLVYKNLLIYSLCVTKMVKVLVLILVLIYKCFAFDVDDVVYDKMPPLFSLDNYHRCLLHNGTYCLVKVELFADPSNDLMMLLKNYTLSTHIMHYNHTYLEKGVCVPTSCKHFIGNRSLESPSELHEVLEMCQNATIFEEYGLEARVSDVYYCHKPNEKQKATLLDWLVLASFILIISVNIYATIFDLKLERNKSRTKETLSTGKEILLCFSLRRNWNFLSGKPKKFPNAPDFSGISFIRVSASFMMVLGHVNWIYTMGFIDNTHDFERAYNRPHLQVIFNGMIVVQIFFVISGFLMMYGLNLNQRELKWGELASHFLNRISRLVPSLSVMLAFTATWLRFLGSGPLWNRHVSPVVNDCGKWWWTHIFFINNYVAENKYCAMQTWHLAADTQLFLTFLIILLLTKSKNRLFVLCTLLLISFVPPALHIYFQDLDALLLKTPEFLRTLDNPNFGACYVFGHNSISCFALGTITAYKLREWHKNGVVFKGKIYRYLFRLCVPAIVLCFLAGSMFYEEDGRTPLWVRILFQSTHRFLFGLPVAFMIVGFAMNFDSVLQNFMQWQGFSVLARLTYSVFLLHMNFIPIIAGSKTQLAHLSYLNMMLYQLGIVALSYLLSIPFFLMVEGPATPLLKILTRPKHDVTKNKAKSEKTETQEKELDEGRRKLLEDSVRECNDMKKSD